MVNVIWKMFGDGCVGHKCMETTVTRPNTLRRASIPLCLKYGLGKAEYSSLAKEYFRVSRSHALSYMITTEHSSYFL